MFGVPALRSEDPRFLRGEGRYLENIPIPDALRAVFVRSIMPHGRVGGIEGLEGGAVDAGGRGRVHRRRPADRSAAAERQRRGSERHVGGSVRARGARARCGPLRRRARRRGDRRFAGARTGRRGDGLAGGRRARCRDRRGGGVRGRRSGALPGPRVEHRACVRTALGCGRVGGSGRRRAGTGRATAAGSGAHGDERDRRGARGRRRVHDLVFDAGAVRRAERPCRAARGRQEAGPDRGARRGRRVRRQADRVSGVRGRGGGGQSAGPSGPVGRDAVGEHAEPQPRTRAGAARRDRREAGRDRGRHARGAARRHGRLSGRGVPAHDHAGDARRRLHDPRDRLAWMERGHERHAGRGLSRRGQAGGDGAGRARDGPDRGGARDGSGRCPAEEHDPRRRLPVPDRLRHDVRHRELRARARRGAEDRRRAEAPGGTGRAARARGPPAARHRRQHVRRDHRVRVEGVRLGAGAPRRHRDRADRRVAAGTGPRDGDGADRLGGPGRAVRDGAGRPLGQRGRASRRGHVGFAVAAGRRLRGRRADAGRRREGPHARVAPARGGRGRSPGAARRDGSRSRERRSARSRGRSSRRPRTTRRGCPRA